MATAGRVYSSRAPIVTLDLFGSPCCLELDVSFSFNTFYIFISLFALHNLVQGVDGCLSKGECLHVWPMSKAAFREGVCFRIEVFYVNLMF